MPSTIRRARSGEYTDASPWEYRLQLQALALMTREYVSAIRSCHHSSKKLYAAVLHSPNDSLITPYHPDLAAMLDGLGADVWSLATACMALPNRATAEVLERDKQTTDLQNYIIGLNRRRGDSLKYGE